jgi:uncharacterized membrane protein
MRTRTFRSLVYLGAGFGLVVSVFAGLEFYDAQLTGACTVNAFFSCALILNSGKTTTFGIQDWIWGVAGFLAILIVAVVADRRRKDARVAYGLFLLTTAGVALAAYFGYVEIAEIHGICPVCVTAYLFGVVTWVGAFGLARRARRRARGETGPIPAPV